MRPDPLLNKTTNKPKSANYSRFMELKMASGTTGKKFNPCLFGCRDHDVDDHGYCHHVIGATVPGRPALMEPIEIDKRGNRVVVGAKRCATPKEAHLERVTTCAWVYDPTAPKPVNTNFDLDVDEDVDPDLVDAVTGEQQELEALCAR